MRSSAAVRILLCVLACVTAARAIAAETVTVRASAGRDLSAAPVHDRVFGYGGGVWHVPLAFPLIMPSILEPGNIGTVRAALAWEVLAASQSPEDLERRLKDYRLNDFLKQVVARGGQVIICLDAMPRWLAADRSAQRLADGPAWAKSPPSDLGAWRKLVAAVVRHFNGRLGLDAGYEIWNEPDHAFRGTLQQYFDLYRASAAGALDADPKARMGGPATSDWAATGTRKTPGSHREGFFLEKFLAFAASTPLPESGRQRLPVDFVSWHAFYRDPAHHYERIVPRVRSWLKAAGYPATTPLVVSEWNIAAEPPYPEGDLNGNHVGAAYVVANVIAMRENGVSAQAFQMMVDPGTPGYSGGTFTPGGLPRPNFNAFRLLSRMGGKITPTTSSDPWVRSLASVDAGHLYVLVVVFVPTAHMLGYSAGEEIISRSFDAFLAASGLDKDSLAAFSRDGRGLAGKLSDANLAVLSAARSNYLEALEKSKRWQDGVALEIQLPAAVREQARAVRFVIDGERSVSPARLAELGSALQAELKRSALELGGELKRRGGAGLERNFYDQLARDLGFGPVAAANAKEVQALKDAFRKLHVEYAALLASKRSEAAFELASDTIALPQSDAPTLRIRVAPNSVHLVVVPLGK